MCLFAICMMVSGLAAVAPAQTVYSCTRDHQRVFQDRPCGGDQQVRVLRVAPPSGPPPGVQGEMAMLAQHQLARQAQRSQRALTPRRARHVPATSFRCTSSEGAVFYRHQACPASVARIARPGSAMQQSGPKRTPPSVRVSAERVDRRTACRELSRAGAIVRAGHEWDEATDTYAKNTGHDPCA